MLSWLDSIPFSMVLLFCLTLGLAPFFPEPHVVEKIRMLMSGTLVIDIFDLLMHGAPFLLLAAKLIRTATTGQAN